MVPSKSKYHSSYSWCTGMCHKRSREEHGKNMNQDQDRSDTENGTVKNCKNIEGFSKPRASLLSGRNFQEVFR